MPRREFPPVAAKEFSSDSYEIEEKATPDVALSDTASIPAGLVARKSF